jgi:hypothetical protein
MASGLALILLLGFWHTPIIANKAFAASILHRAETKAFWTFPGRQSESLYVNYRICLIVKAAAEALAPTSIHALPGRRGESLSSAS